MSDPDRRDGDRDDVEGDAITMDAEIGPGVILYDKRNGKAWVQCEHPIILRHYR